MIVRDIVKKYLEENDYTGLLNDVSCGCEIDDLMPCDEPSCGCEPGHKVVITKENKEKYQNEINELELKIGDWLISVEKEAK